MSPPSSFSNETVQIFRNVNGNVINLKIKNEKENKVRTFIIHGNEKIHVWIEILKCCVFLVTCLFVNRLLFIFIFGVLLLWHYKNLATTVVADSLLVIESVGVQIVSRRRCFGLYATEFLPWNIIQDVFINEVIVERRVLYYLTFLVETENQGTNPVRLVPLFRNMKPEKKCLEHIYLQLATFIKPVNVKKS